MNEEARIYEQEDVRGHSRLLVRFSDGQGFDAHLPTAMKGAVIEKLQAAFGVEVTPFRAPIFPRLGSLPPVGA